MPKVVKREAAKRDLIQRWVWYAENASVETADRFLGAVETTLRNLARQPLSGQIVPVRSVPKEIRRVPVGDGFGKTLLFYRPLPDGIDLIRVLHGSQNLASLFNISSV